MQLIQIAAPTPVPTISIRELFERMARRESDALRAARAACDHRPTRKPRRRPAR